jgi:ubiquinone/menaquinone biosynthesis C-methylase UbiE
MPEVPYARPGHIFTSCAASYVRFRPRHPARLMQHLAAEVTSCSGPPTVLDVGCGPGTVSLDLAERGLDVIAVDPSSEMLAAGRESARECGLGAIRWVEADVRHLADPILDIAPVAAATIGDAFHWMERSAALDVLDRLVRPDGFVALIGSRAPGSAKPWWDPLLVRLRERYLGSSHWAGPGVDYVEPLGGHEEILRRSSFHEITVVRTDYTLSVTLDQLVGLQLTYAYSSPAVLGEKRAAFEADLRSTLTTVQPNGLFIANLQAALIMGRRNPGMNVPV